MVPVLTSFPIRVPNPYLVIFYGILNVDKLKLNVGNNTLKNKQIEASPDSQDVQVNRHYTRHHAVLYLSISGAYSCLPSRFQIMAPNLDKVNNQVEFLKHT